ncbi:MAG: hypothetical protein ABFD98_15775 [Syntrophobacteraceae bacterium]|nr:hypothetical protein [Desulfobacteraceae bacterium]
MEAKQESVLDMTVREAFQECRGTLRVPNGAALVRTLGKKNGDGTLGGALIVVVGDKATREVLDMMNLLGGNWRQGMDSSGKKYVDDKGRILRVFFDPRSNMYGTWYEHHSDTGMCRLKSMLLPVAETASEAQTLLDAYAEDNGLQAVPTAEELRDLLSLATDKVPSLERMESWTDMERAEAARWAGAIYLRASDNPVRVPPVPEVMMEGRDSA